MRKNPNPLADPARRAAFVKRVARDGDTRGARRAFAMTTGRYFYARRIFPGFAAAVDAACGATPRARRLNMVWTARKRAEFLDAIVETGSAARAALKTGMSENYAHRLRRIDGAFAGAWADAVGFAYDRVEDRLRDVALNGSVRRATVDGRTTVTVTDRPDIMLRVLDKRPGGFTGGGGRWLELTPELMAQAKTRLETQLRMAAAGKIVIPEAPGAA